ncbi:zinc-regulated transporter 2, partial [Auriculariales sp. MPI-PUGE-AT-0066]
DLLGLRIGSIFVILVASLLGGLLPIIFKPSRPGRATALLYDFFKYFGSGVIIATAFIHLLTPGIEALGSECLTGTWTEYPWAPALAMISLFVVFLVELIAFRVGTSRLERLHAAYDSHGHGAVGGAAHGPEPSTPRAPPANELAIQTNLGSDGTIGEAHGETKAKHFDAEHGHSHPHTVSNSAMAQLLGVGILEFGVVFHSILVGLTLAVDGEFKILFVVLTIHQAFEGLGLGARLSALVLPQGYRWVPYAGAILFACTTPVGIAVGLGARKSYEPESPTALMVSGVFDSLSAGVLLYTGVAELLAHEFLFNPHLARMSNKRLTFACVSMLLGAALMSLLGRWA